jgi:hypothetical protein
MWAAIAGFKRTEQAMVVLFTWDSSLRATIFVHYELL